MVANKGPITLESFKVVVPSRETVYGSGASDMELKLETMLSAYSSNHNSTLTPSLSGHDDLLQNLWTGTMVLAAAL